MIYLFVLEIIIFGILTSCSQNLWIRLKYSSVSESKAFFTKDALLDLLNPNRDHFHNYN